MEHSEEQSREKLSQSSLEKKIDIMQYARNEMLITKEEIREILRTDMKAYKEKIRKRDRRIANIAYIAIGLLLGSNIWAWVSLHDRVQKALDNEVTKIQNNVKLRLDKEFEQPTIRKTVQEVAATSAQQILRNDIQPEVNNFKKQIESNLTVIQKSVDSAQLRVSDLSSTIATMNQQIQLTKKIALVLADSVDTSMAVHSFMEYINLPYKIEQVEHLKKILREMGIPENDIDKSVGGLNKRIRRDHMRRILDIVNKQLPDNKKISKDIWTLDVSAWDINRVRKLLKDNAIEEKGDLKDAILDLEYYEKNKKLRRENIWQG